MSLVALVTIEPFVAFLQHNRDQIRQPEKVVVYGLVTALLTQGVLWLVVRWRRQSDADRLAVVVAVVVFTFLHFSWVFDPNPHNARRLVAVVLVWLVLTAGLARVAYLLARYDGLRTGLLVYAVVAALVPALGYASEEMSSSNDVERADAGPVTVPEERPNVYFILVDGYARPDVLERTTGYDDGPFVAALEDRGFQVSESTFTSYPRTHLSLASTLDMDYDLLPGHDIEDEFGHFAPVVVGNNATAARFRAMGYEIVYGPAGSLEWSACRPALVDHCLPPHRPTLAVGELEQTLLDLTPLGVLPLPTAYADPTTFVDGLSDPKSGIEAPFFAYQHVLSPHWPFRYRDDCTARDRAVDQRGMSGAERLDAYATQVRCLNGMLEDAVDDIVARDPKAVIIIQSDHGSDHTFSWYEDPEDWDPGQVTERYAAFSAMRLPEDCDTDIEGQPLVNTFRIVFACIEHRAPDLLEYRAFAQPLDHVEDLTELAPDRFEEDPRPS